MNKHLLSFFSYSVNRRTVFYIVRFDRGNVSTAKRCGLYALVVRQNDFTQMKTAKD